jgi:hypothetical protein
MIEHAAEAKAIERDGGTRRGNRCVMGWQFEKSSLDAVARLAPTTRDLIRAILGGQKFQENKLLASPRNTASKFFLMQTPWKQLEKKWLGISREAVASNCICHIIYDASKVLLRQRFRKCHETAASVPVDGCNIRRPLCRHHRQSTRPAPRQVARDMMNARLFSIGCR